MKVLPFPARLLALSMAITWVSATFMDSAETPLESQLVAAKQARDRQSVAEIYRRLRSERPNDLEILKGVIRAEFAVSNYEAGRALVADLGSRVAATDPDLLEFRGDLLRRDERMDDAVAAWQAALRADPDRLEVLAKLARHFLHHEENAAMAATYFDRLRALRSAAEDHVEVGKVAIAMRDWTEVIECTRALKAEFAQDRLAKNQIPAFERVTQAATRIADLDARERAAEDPIPIMLERSRLFLDFGFADQALRDARIALEAKPQALHVRFHYAAAAARLGLEWERLRSWGIEPYRIRRTAPPKEFLERLSVLDAELFEHPEAFSTLAERALLLFEHDQFELAGRDANDLVELDPEHVTGLRVHALVSAEQRAYGQAADAIDQALRLAPDDPEVLDAASAIHTQQGEYERVLDLCDRWLRLEADNETATERRQIAMENLQRVTHGR